MPDDRSEFEGAKLQIELRVDSSLVPSVLRAFAGTTPLDAEVDVLEIRVVLDTLSSHSEGAAFFAGPSQPWIDSDGAVLVLEESMFLSRWRRNEIHD